jgi:hypothetical protein
MFSPLGGRSERPARARSFDEEDESPFVGLLQLEAPKQH